MHTSIRIGTRVYRTIPVENTTVPFVELNASVHMYICIRDLSTTPFNQVFIILTDTHNVGGGRSAGDSASPLFGVFGLSILYRSFFFLFFPEKNIKSNI